MLKTVHLTESKVQPVNPIITTASGNNRKSSNNSTKDGSSSACHRYVRVYIFVLFSHFNDYDMSK
jgi:hypothetical protein